MRERTDVLQSKDRDLAALRKKEQNFHSTIESIQSKLDAEILRNKDLEGQVRIDPTDSNVILQAIV